MKTTHPAPVGEPTAMDELPRHSPWPGRLLQAAGAIGHPKTRESVLREFDRDKWGSLLDELRRGEASLARLEALIAPPGKEVLYSCRGALLRASADKIQQSYIAYLASQLGSVAPVDLVAELGGGAGNLLLHLARHSRIAKEWVSYELSARGREITELVARGEGLSVKAAPVDFDRAFEPENGADGKRAIYLSSFALAYCREPYPFLASVLDRKPVALLLVEPVPQFFDEGSLIGLLARRYFEYNDYCGGLWPAVQRLEREGRIEIVRVDENVFGHNPLCPVSALQLAPRRA